MGCIHAHFHPANDATDPQWAQRILSRNLTPSGLNVIKNLE